MAENEYRPKEEKSIVEEVTQPTKKAKTSAAADKEKEKKEIAKPKVRLGDSRHRQLFGKLR